MPSTTRVLSAKSSSGMSSAIVARMTKRCVSKRTGHGSTCRSRKSFRRLDKRHLKRMHDKPICQSLRLDDGEQHGAVLQGDCLVNHGSGQRHEMAARNFNVAAFHLDLQPAAQYLN